ncbi:MAG: hypothetical protein CFK49_11955, partial [Armatimonadetes bacterium JP3_11]
MRAVGLATVLLTLTAFGQPGERVEFETHKALHYDSASDTVQGEAITARWREYFLEATRLEGYLRKAEYRLFDGVRLRSEKLRADGNALTLYTRERRWIL